MQRLSKRRIPGDTMRIDFQNNRLIIYTSSDRNIYIYELNSFRQINHIILDEDIVNISISYPSLIITARTHIFARNLYTNTQDASVYIPNCLNAYLLRNRKLVAVHGKKFYIYNMHNQEESKYNYEILKFIDDNLLFYYNKRIYQMQNNCFIEVEKIIEETKENFDFTLYNNKVTVMNGFKINNKNYRLEMNYFDKYPQHFKFTSNFIYFGLDNNLYIYDRKENTNVNLKKISLKSVTQNEIRPINLSKQWAKEHIKYDFFEVYNNVLVVLYNNKLYSYRIIENNVHDYIICDISYDYKEAECEFDISCESDLIDHNNL